jgi:hypothetical protein
VDAQWLVDDGDPPRAALRTAQHRHLRDDGDAQRLVHLVAGPQPGVQVVKHQRECQAEHETKHCRDGRARRSARRHDEAATWIVGDRAGLLEDGHIGVTDTGVALAEEAHRLGRERVGDGRGPVPVGGGRGDRQGLRARVLLNRQP